MADKKYVEKMFDFDPPKWYESIYYRICRYFTDSKYWLKCKSGGSSKVMNLMKFGTSIQRVQHGRYLDLDGLGKLCVAIPLGSQLKNGKKFSIK
jgi:hypothetical protein